MRLRRNEYCPIHRSISCCGREQTAYARRLKPGIRRIDDPHHPRGYRELRSPAEMRKLDHGVNVAEPQVVLSRLCYLVSSAETRHAGERHWNRQDREAVPDFFPYSSPPGRRANPPLSQRVRPPSQHLICSLIVIPLLIIARRVAEKLSGVGSSIAGVVYVLLLLFLLGSYDQGASAIYQASLRIVGGLIGDPGMLSTLGRLYRA